MAEKKRKIFTNVPGSAHAMERASRKPLLGSARQGTPRTIQRGTGPISPDYGRSRRKGPSMFDDAVDAVKGMPTGPGSFRGKAGKARSQTRRIKQARALADLYSGKDALGTKEAGATERARISDTGATRRTGMQQAGDNLRSQNRLANQQQLQQQEQTFTTARDKQMSD